MPNHKDIARVAAFRKQVDADPGSLVFVVLAETLNRMERFEEAAEVCEAGIRHHPDSASGHLALAVAESGRENIKSALVQIKSALAIDSENPRALALMGSLLLDRGLATRAVQFLDQAVMIAPKRAEYQDLLRRARRLAKLDSSIALPKISEEDFEQAEHPWSDRAPIPVPSDSIENAQEEEGTEFDLGSPNLAQEDFATVDQAELEKLQDSAEVQVEESTQYASVKDMLGDLKGERPTSEESDAAAIVSSPRVGGSASEFPHALSKGAIPEIRDDSELRTRALHEIRPAVEAPSVRRAKTAQSKVVSQPDPSPAVAAPRKLTPLAAPVAKAETKEIEATPVDAKPRSSDASPPEEKPPEDDRPSTMFVDDAVWDLLGAKPPEAESNALASVAEENKSSPQKAPARSDRNKAVSKRRRSVLVVRTAKHFGQITRLLIASLIMGILFYSAYSIAVQRAGSTSADSADDIKGIASDIERSSLASLRNARDALTELLTQVPAAKSALLGARAEVSALIWSRFGHIASDLTQAKNDLAELNLDAPSLAALHAMLLVYQGSMDVEKIQHVLDEKQEELPSSPKLWLVQAQLAKVRGSKKDILPSILEAYRLNPKNRNTLFSLAQWHGLNRSFAAMGRRLNEILNEEQYRDDIEALLDATVVAHLLGDDTQIGRMQSRLSGVVRDQGIAVASDEIGRASLVFAVMNLITQDRNQALQHLFSASEAYAESLEFKLAVAECLQLLGEFEQSRKQVEAALRINPTHPGALRATARIQYVDLIGLKKEDARFGNEIGSPQQANLEFGTAELNFSLFTKVEVRMSAAIFPENDYRRAARTLEGEALKNELFFINLSRAARSRFAEGEFRAAQTLFERALRLSQRPQVHSGLGLTFLALKKLDQAAQSFKAAIRMDRDSAEAQFGLAEVHLRRDQDLKAIEILERLHKDGFLVPAATMRLAQLQAKRGDDDGARDLLLDLSAAMPQSLRVFLALGRSQHATGHAESALDAYKRAMGVSSQLASKPALKRRRNPDQRTAVDFLYLGRILAKRSAARAKRMYRASSELNGTPNETHYFLGKLLVKKTSSRRLGRRSLKLYLRKSPKGAYAQQARKLMRRR